MRSDPFILAWLIDGGVMRKFQNLLFNDNVLSIVVEFDTARVLNPGTGSLFAVIAETIPIPRSGRLCRTSTATDGLGWPSRADQCST